MASGKNENDMTRKHPIGIQTFSEIIREGYVYVDNDQFTRADFESYPNWKTDAAYMLDHIWRVVHYSSGGTDMYKINVTVLPDDEGGDGDGT